MDIRNTIDRLKHSRISKSEESEHEKKSHDEMAKKYERMLGRQDIEVLHNGAENRCLDIPTPDTGPFNEKNPFIVCFLGGLFSHLHGNCIEDVAQAISQIRRI